MDGELSAPALGENLDTTMFCSMIVVSNTGIKNYCYFFYLNYEHLLVSLLLFFCQCRLYCLFIYYFLLNLYFLVYLLTYFLLYLDILSTKSDLLTLILPVWSSFSNDAALVLIDALLSLDVLLLLVDRGPIG